MGRPSQAEQRRAEIMTAVGRCVARHGVSGTTLERISIEAGLSRGDVRHYLGNRDALITAFAQHVGEHYRQAMERARSAAPVGRQSEAVLRLLFGREWGPSDDNPAIDALLTAAANDDALRQEIRSAYLDMERTLTSALRKDFPSAPSAVCADTAYALISMAFGHSTLSQLAFPAARRKAARSTAKALVERLRASQEQRSAALGAVALRR